MSALVIVWIPTHIWSLAIKEREEYKAAKIPMLPVIVSERVATVCIAITSSLLVVFSLAILFVPNAASPFYIVSAAALGAVILGYSVKLVIDKTTKTAWTLFKLSSPYLTVIFIVIVLNIWLFLTLVKKRRIAASIIVEPVASKAHGSSKMSRRNGKPRASAETTC